MMVVSGDTSRARRISRQHVGGTGSTLQTFPMSPAILDSLGTLRVVRVSSQSVYARSRVTQQVLSEASPAAYVVCGLERRTSTLPKPAGH